MDVITTIDPRLIKMVGRKMYSSHPLIILVRELMQNSVDACRRKGVEPDITIRVESEGDIQRTTTVTCLDNGIGMTERQIVEDFLCLGGKKSNGTGQTGGFGIAKAAIMSGSDWRVDSLDNVIDQYMLEKGLGIEKTTDFLDGTRVTVKLPDETIYWSTIVRAVLMVVLSDVQVRLEWRSGSSSFTYEHAGLQNFLLPAKLRVIDKSSFGDVSLFDAVDAEFGEKTYNFRGLNVVRLNGLVQFVGGNIWGDEDRTTNLVFDVNPQNWTPEDDSYPLTMSREKLTNNYDDVFKAIIKAHDTNVLQSKVAAVVDPAEEMEVSIVDGSLSQGERSKSYAEQKDSGPSMGNQTGWTKLKVEHHEPAVKRNTSEKPRLLIRRYNKEHPNRDARYLRVWHEIMRLVASSEEQFGIGITSDGFVHAQRVVLDGTIFYVLNPEAVDPELSDKGIVIRLWALGCHEATHFYVSQHNERFTTTMDEIMTETSDVIYRNITRIARLLK